jgi:nitroimidazol reductase NimA-like FMN-containing flavoprotein (pyridoxamine 5'-phosphate oxidase superfamily)
MASPSSTPSAARLSTAECWTLLQSQQIGRMALVDGEGVPEIYPVSFTTHEGAIYLRTARDSKLSHLHTRPVAAFEIDGEDDGTRWSVVVRGEAAQLRDEREIDESGVMDVVSLTPTRKPYVIKITPHSVTGRRFSKDLRPERTAPIPPANESTDGPKPKRSERPDPIPHHPPASAGSHEDR